MRRLLVLGLALALLVAVQLPPNYVVEDFSARWLGPGSMRVTWLVRAPTKWVLSPPPDAPCLYRNPPARERTLLGCGWLGVHDIPATGGDVNYVGAEENERFTLEASGAVLAELQPGWPYRVSLPVVSR